MIMKNKTTKAVGRLYKLVKITKNTRKMKKKRQ